MGSFLKSLVVLSSLFTAALANYARSNGTYSNSTISTPNGNGGQSDVVVVTVIVSKPVATICPTTTTLGSSITITYTGGGGGGGAGSSSESGGTVSTTSAISTTSTVVTSPPSSSSVSTTSGIYYNTTSSVTSSGSLTTTISGNQTSTTISSSTPTGSLTETSITGTPTPSSSPGSSTTETPTPTPTPSPPTSSSPSSSTPTPTPSSSTPTPTPSSTTPTPTPSSSTPTPTPSSTTPTPTPSSSTTSSSTSSSSPTPTPSQCAYWMENISHQGIAPFSGNSGYQVFRNVKDFGAKGDGKTDDTAAINLAISSANRCAPGTCGSTTTTPAVIYFPAGTYVVSSPIIDYYYTQLVGNPNCLPVIQATASFSARWVIDGNQYQAGGALGWGATNVFWRQIRNFVIDMTLISPSVEVAGIHWATAQATSLQNVKVEMSTASGNKQEGIFIESGSGGFMNDLVFNGGTHGITVGNQQFTMRNITITNAVTAIFQLWDWGWTYQGVTIDNCGVGLDMSSLATDGSQSVASVTFLDSTISNTPIFVKMVRSTTSTYPTGGSLVLENIILKNVPTAIQGPNSAVVLAGTSGQTTIAGWAQGHSYTPTGPNTIQGAIVPNSRGKLASGSIYYERSKPQYEGYPASAFVSVRTAGAKGDGVTDDSSAINTLLVSAAASGKIVYFDAGDYLVTRTIFVPAGSRIVGEAYSVILSSGSFFNSMSAPKPVVQIGLPGQTGSIEWSDMIVSTKGAQAGAILIQYNLASTGTPSGLWDVHTRIGGFAGSNLQLADCPVTSTVVATASNINTNCIAAFLSFHVTPQSSGLYLENVWLWVADHDIEDPTLRQITIFAGRGLLIESEAGNIWAYGTAVEHHVFYQYQFSSTKNAVLGQIQTETAYYQPNPAAPLPFAVNAAYKDPVIPAGGSGYGLRIVDSENLFFNGAGLYSFFSNNDVHCSDQGNGETCQKRIFSVESSSDITVYNLNTVGTGTMITVDGTDVASYSDNIGGFIDTVALFKV